MKKFLVLALAIVTVFALAACGLTGNLPSGNGTSGGDTDPGTQQTDPGTSTPDTSTDYDLFAHFGLSGIVPANYTSVVRHAENLSANSADYTFTVPLGSDGDTDRMNYANQVLAAVQGASDDGKAYKEDVVYNEATQKYDPVYVERGAFSSPLDDYQLPDFYFYRGSELLILTLSDKEANGNHQYSVTIITQAALDALLG